MRIQNHIIQHYGKTKIVTFFSVKVTEVLHKVVHLC